MQAVVLSGGFGTRLRPLTYKVPKPLLPIANVPMIEYVLAVLPDEVDRVVLATNYMVEQLEEYFEKKEHPFEVVINTEPEPLGTGGAVKFAQKYIDDTFFVLNGDLISSLDAGKMAQFHRKSGGVGTIALYEVEDPTPFGMITTDDDGRIQEFKEKPKPEEVTSNTINAGTYILEPEVLDVIPDGQKISIERETFPSLVPKGLYGLPFQGYWCDAGTLPKFLEANGLILENDKALAAPLQSYVESIGHLCVGKNVQAKGDPVLKDSVILDEVVIEDGVSIDNCIIGSGSTIGQGSILSGTIVGYDQDVPPGTKLTDGKIPPEN